MEKSALYSKEVQAIDIQDIVRRKLNGADTPEGREEAVLALFADPKVLARFEAWDEVLAGLLCNERLSFSLHRARYHDTAPLVRRTEALAIGNMVIDLFNAAAEEFVQAQVEHWGLQEPAGCEPEGAA